MNNETINRQELIPKFSATQNQSSPGLINLAIPSFPVGSKKKKLGNTIPIKKWHQLHTKPEVLLHEVANFIQLTNHEKADTLDRIYLAETSLNTVTRGINIIYNKYLQQNEFPEPELQLDYLNTAINVIQQINTAYKHIFNQEFESFNSSLNLVSDRVRLAGFRIIELIQIEQRLLASTYKALPDISWKDLNQVFYIFWHFDGYSQSRTLSGTLKTNPENEQVSFPDKLSSSAFQLYLSTQLFGLVDGYSFPNKTQHMVDAYLSLLDYKLPITAYNGDDLVDGQLVIFKNQSKPLNFKMKNIDTPATQLDIFDLWRIVKKDSEAQLRINGGYTDTISTALATLGEPERLPHIENLIKKLRHYTRRDTRKNSVSAEPLRIIVGYSESHKALENTTSISDDQQQNTDKCWSLIDVSEGGFRVRASASACKTKISVGKMIAFNDGQPDFQALKLGFIKRITRLNETEIDVSVAKLGKSAKSIVIHNIHGNEKDSTITGFLIQLSGSLSQLILPFSWKVKPQQQLKINFHGGQNKIVIKKPSLQQSNFTVYNITPIR